MTVVAGGSLASAVTTRSAYLEELARENDAVLALGGLAVEAVERSARALALGDRAVADQVIGGDDDVDQLAYEVERRAVSLQTLQAPVASDLRLLHTATLVAVSLERVGDLAVNVARIAKQLNRAHRDASLETLVDGLAVRSRELLSAALEAFAARDVALGASLQDADDANDRDFAAVLRAVSALEGDPGQRAWGTDIALAARHYERVGDNAVRIGARVRYLATGEMPPPRRRGDPLAADPGEV